MDLHRIARSNRVDELLAALESGAEVNKKDQFGATSLHSAISEKSTEAAIVLLNHGADVTIGDSNGRTALHYAIEHKLLPLAEAILRADPSAVDVADVHGNQPLWTAAFNARGDYDYVRLLLRYGANPSHENRGGLSPADIPIRTGDAILGDLLGRPRGENSSG